ncbi:alternative splicing factor ASF-1 [Plasmodium gonderi]|uniref:Alternative splicing factor ASF-1 n=1 Tax=Plasmodium gonderi TaxID=77519 RepID=A0A1Y1JEN0_PLAGO|nr:alternative splicing factor ASF-1 [Plasmodium gonderi]GAW80966.1 alternative splicing factor ASF-1 [Plasmodium gonderi]
MKIRKKGNRIYVGNIPGSMSKEEIKKTFEEQGKIKEIDIKYNRNSNGTNYAFIEYEDYQSAEKTILKRNGQRLKGYMLKVEYSIDKNNKDGELGTDVNGIRTLKNRSKYRVVVKNFPKKIHLGSVKTFLTKAGKVIYTHFENGITIAEFENKEGMLRAVNTLDRIAYNSRRKVYVRVIKDLPFDDSDADDMPLHIPSRTFMHV